jgi:NMD protein affecting ribosome stability and mRNA decay
MKRMERSRAFHPSDRRIAGRAQDDPVHDPYERRAKPPDLTVCPHCGAVFHDGRWQWMQPPEERNRAPCPACQRARNDDPAGIVSLAGAFALCHRDEILNLVRHQEEAEKAEHALNRIMAIRDLPDGIEIATTDIHLPRRIGEAVQRAYGGELSFHYEQARYFLRVGWSRADGGHGAG